MTKSTNIQQEALSVPKGYKNSPLGIIPEEWEVKRLGDISTQLGNFSFSRAQLTDNTQRLRYIHYGDIHLMSDRDNVDLKKDELPFLLDGLIEKRKVENQDFPLLKDGDIIFADASEDYEGIGNCWEVLNTNGHDIISGLHTIPIRCKKEYVAVGFGRYIFKNRKSSTALRVIAHGTKVYSLSYRNMAKLNITLPSLPEQQKIAEILSTWDVTIEKQNALIEQLELRKRGLMQQLLTGKLRLRNASEEKFKEEWKKVRLGKVGEICYGTRIVQSRSEKGEYDVYGGGGKTFTTTSYNREDCLIISRFAMSENCVRFVKGRFFLNDSGLSVKAYAEISQMFLDYILISMAGKIYKLSAGGAQQNLNIKSFQKMVFFIPSLSEQTAIAEVLSTADREIEIEKQKLATLQNQKKGLMQVLLSGKVRVKI